MHFNIEFLFSFMKLQTYTIEQKSCNLYLSPYFLRTKIYLYIHIFKANPPKRRDKKSGSPSYPAIPPYLQVDELAEPIEVTPDTAPEQAEEMDTNGAPKRRSVEVSMSSHGNLGGGFKYFLFSLLFGEDSQFD